MKKTTAEQMGIVILCGLMGLALLNGFRDCRRIAQESVPTNTVGVADSPRN